MKKESLLLLVLFLFISFVSFTQDYIKIHYKNNCEKTYVQFKADENDWAKLPNEDQKLKIAEVFSQDEKENKKIKMEQKFYLNNEAIEGKFMSKSIYYQNYKFVQIPANFLEFKFVNDNNELEDNNGENYKIYSAGEYILEDGILSEIGLNKIQIHYKTGWIDARIHFNYNDKDWTDAPGMYMDTSYIYKGYKVFTVPAEKMNFVINDGENNWDNAPGGGNYTIERPGIYKLEDGEIRAVVGDVIDNNINIGLYYKTNLDKVYINYTASNREYKENVEMEDVYGKKNLKFIVIPNADKMTFTFTDEEGNIYDNNGSYYEIDHAGMYKVNKKDNLKELEFNGVIYPTVKPDKGYGLKIRKATRGKVRFLNYEKLNDTLYRINVNENQARKPYSFEFDSNVGNKLKVLKNGIVVEEREILRNELLERWEADSVHLPEGELYIEVINEDIYSKGFNNIKNLLGKVFNIITFTQTTYASEKIADGISLISYGGWQTCEYSSISTNYVTIGYNLWLDFELSSTWQRADVSVVLGGKRYGQYNDATPTLSGKVKYSIDIMNALVLNGLIDDVLNSPQEINFDIYVNGQFKKGCIYKISKVTKENTQINIGLYALIPNIEERKYLGYNPDVHKQYFYILDKNNLDYIYVLNPNEMGHIFYDGYWKNKTGLKNELLVVDDKVSENLVPEIKAFSVYRRDKNIRISWSRSWNDLGLGYELYKGTSPDDMTKIWENNWYYTTDYTDEDVEDGETYYYKMRIHRFLNGIKASGEFTITKEYTLNIPETIIVEDLNVLYFFRTKSNDSIYIKFNWDGLYDYDNFKVYKSEELVYNGPLKEYKDENFINNKLNSYRFEGYKNGVLYGNKTLGLKSPFTYRYKSFNNIELNMKASNEEGCYYYLYRGGIRIYDGTETKYIDQGISIDKDYKYEVLVHKNSEVLGSFYIEAKKAIDIKNIVFGEKGIEFSWEKKAGKKYEIYKKFPNMLYLEKVTGDSKYIDLNVDLEGDYFYFIIEK